MKSGCRIVRFRKHRRRPVINLDTGTVCVRSEDEDENELHLRAYGHADPDQPVEVVTVRLSAFGALPVAGADRPAGDAAPPGDAASAGDAAPPGLEPPGAAGFTRPGAAARIGRAAVRLPGAPAVRAVPVYDR